MPEIRRVGKSGNSLGVMLPKSYLSALNVRHGDQVFLELVADTIVISKAVSVRASTLADKDRDRARP